MSLSGIGDPGDSKSEIDPMDVTGTMHPDDRTLEAYGLRRLDEGAAATVDQHLKGCPACQTRVAGFTSDTFLDRLRPAEDRPGPASVAFPLPDDGARPAASPASALAPELADLSDYRVERELGRGGMGVVYLAHNTLMGRMEVLKVVASHVVSRPGAVDRFLREIRSAARLHHPHIVTAYSALRLGDGLALAMEYVEGHNLAQHVEAKGPLPIAYACNFAYQAANGLQHAHEHGMVHRDIKPANLILTLVGKKGVVKVLDFGLAKVTSEDRADGTLTGEGQMLGTPNFIAPEQIRDPQSADIRADIYSLGCTLYYLIAGRPPFRGDNVWDVCQAHCSMEAEPLDRVRPEAPEELAAVVATMMAKDPNPAVPDARRRGAVLKPFFKPAAVTRGAHSPDAAAPTILADRVATQPASPLAGPTWPGPGPTTLGSDAVAWEQLIEIPPDDLLVDPDGPRPTAIDHARTARPPRKSGRRTAAIAATAVVVLGAILSIRAGLGRRTGPAGTPSGRSVLRAARIDPPKRPERTAGKVKPQIPGQNPDRVAEIPADMAFGGTPFAEIADPPRKQTEPGGLATRSVEGTGIPPVVSASGGSKKEDPGDPIGRKLDAAKRAYQAASEAARRSSSAP